MFETLNRWDTQAFLWVNHHDCTVLDWVMWVLSQHWSFALVVAAATLPLLFRREEGRLGVRRTWWMALAGVALCFLLADQGSVHLFKDTVCRLRPCHALEGVRMFRTHCGGQYGFVSSHAANAFALVSFILLTLKAYASTKCHTYVAIALIVWAVATCYSRAYLGKHYPGDLLCGALFGVLVGWLVWMIFKWVEKKMQKNETK